MAARRKATAHLKPGTVATHTPTGQRVTVAWESNGPRGVKGPWYWCRFPVAVPGVTETNREGMHMATVHGSTLSYAGMQRNPSSAARKPTWGLFVHNQDSRYRLAGMIAGTRLYVSRAAAEKAAKAMNDRGEHGGMVVVREPLDVARLTTRSNPFDGSKRQAIMPDAGGSMEQRFLAHEIEQSKKVGVGPCECEHAKHFDGGNGHAYQGVPSVVRIDTTMGKFNVCQACATGCLGKYKRNPPLVVFGNPPMDPWDRTFYNVTGKRLGTKGAKVLSRRAISIRYVHAKDGQRYEHKFGPNDCIELLPDGSFRIYNKQGKNLWKDFG